MKNKYFSILIIILLFCSACQNPIVAARRPTSQANTKWKSEDGSIVFSVDNNNLATGEMIIDNETIEFCLSTDFGIDMYLFPIDVLNEDGPIDTSDRYELWICSYKSKEKFVAKVEETTFFNIGDKITFYRESERKTGDGSLS